MACNEQFGHYQAVLRKGKNGLNLQAEIANNRLIYIDLFSSGLDDCLPLTESLPATFSDNVPD